MIDATYPSLNRTHRRADLSVHIIGLALIVVAGSVLLLQTTGHLQGGLRAAVLVYVLCGLASNLASCAYHFSPWHSARKSLRRIDHAAIYLSITGTFTPFLVLANTTWTLSLLFICWGLTAVAVVKKITDQAVKSRWSTASYLVLGAIGLCALPDLGDVPAAAIWCVVAGAVCYVIGTGFYVRKAMPFRYAIWHGWVNIGGVLMFAGIWMSLV